MSLPRTRPRFIPDVLRGESRDAVNAAFRADAAAFALRFTCGDCVYAHSVVGNCTVGWPNDHLLGSVDGVDARDEPVFCKAFEAHGS